MFPLKQSFMLLHFLVYTILLCSCSPLGSPIDSKISKNHYYNRLHTNVYYCPKGNWVQIGNREMPNVDKDSFEVLSPFFSKDKNAAYYGENMVVGATSDSFELIAKHYAKDKNNVYRGENTVVEANPQTFRIVQFEEGYHSYYGTDNNAIFFREKLVTSDVVNFKPRGNLGPLFFSDAKKIYYLSGRLVELVVDPDSFSFLPTESFMPFCCYGKDKDKVYYIKGFAKEVHGADVISFRVPSKQGCEKIFAVDKNSIYLNGETLIGKTPSDLEDLLSVLKANN